MSSLAKALLDELSDVELDLLAQRLAPRLERLSCPKTRSTWLDVGEAADHLRCPKSRLYALVSARRIPHHKDGSRLLFRREELDEWVYNGGARRP